MTIVETLQRYASREYHSTHWADGILQIDAQSTLDAIAQDRNKTPDERD